MLADLRWVDMGEGVADFQPALAGTYLWMAVLPPPPQFAALATLNGGNGLYLVGKCGRVMGLGIAISFATRQLAACWVRTPGKVGAR
jgi:hypothetical protein